MKYALAELLEKIRGQYLLDGDPADKQFDNIKPIFEANEQSLTWLNPSRPDADQLAQNTRSQIIICHKNYNTQQFKGSGKCFIKVEVPKLTFLRLAGYFFKQEPEYGIHPSAVIHKEAQVHPRSYIGAGTYIGKCTIGEGSVIYGNCYLYDNTVVGARVTISAGTVIGADGFGYARNEEGVLEKFPHIGGVVIEDDVDIGANTCIDKGSLGNTLIKKGAKIDNLVHIAHNVVIGENSMVIANSMIGGSTMIGANSWIAPSVSVRDALVLGENVMAGMGAVVTRNVPAGETWAGSPAKELGAFKEQLRKIENLK